jgi:hypothetical protein
LAKIDAPFGGIVAIRNFAQPYERKIHPYDQARLSTCSIFIPGVCAVLLEMFVATMYAPISFLVRSASAPTGRLMLP